ncbi:MAG: hypothetical protein QGF81_06580, partial [Dehalococcoidia bacterium]|nr:hypothetical protein [Dehalococcoidia bacterium]
RSPKPSTDDMHDTSIVSLMFLDESTLESQGRQRDTICPHAFTTQRLMGKRAPQSQTPYADPNSALALWLLGMPPNAPR